MRHGIQSWSMEFSHGAWNSVSFMEFSQFHGIRLVYESLHGRMTGISTRRALYGHMYTVLGTIRLKARKVSALRNTSISGPRICPYLGFILRSFWCNSAFSCSGWSVCLSAGRYLTLFWPISQVLLAWMGGYTGTKFSKTGTKYSHFLRPVWETSSELDLLGN